MQINLRMGLLGIAAVLLLSSVADGQSRKSAIADPFGVKQLFPTARGGRQWFASWQQSRSVGRYARDSADLLFRNSDGVLNIANDIASVPAGQTRLFIDTPRGNDGGYTAAPWRNVEMTVYFKRGEATRETNGQAISLSARSGEQHSDDAPCEGTSYHASLRLDGQCGFKKEVWHTGGYSNLLPERPPQPWATVPENMWIGMKFVCRNCDSDAHVQLQLYVDGLERNAWQLVAEVTDRGGWEGRQPGCDRPQDYIIAEARPSVYFRADYIPLEIKRFSVREIEPLR